MCDKIVNAANSVSTNVINTIPRNTTSTVSINSDNEKVRYKLDRYIFAHFFISDHINIHNGYYLLSLHKT